MDYLKNHCWCSSSNWDGKNYDCQIIVGLSSSTKGYSDDWESVLEDKDVFSLEDYKYWKKIYSDEGIDFPEEKLIRFSTKRIKYPKQEILKWLDENVKDLPNGEKGWCIGSDGYIARGSSCSFSFFLQRRIDAMNFIKVWSKWKNPISYTQYFTDVRKVLTLETLKYEKRGE